MTDADLATRLRPIPGGCKDGPGSYHIKGKDAILRPFKQAVRSFQTACGVVQHAVAEHLENVFQVQNYNMFFFFCFVLQSAAHTRNLVVFFP